MLKVKNSSPLTKVFDDLLDYFKPFVYEKGLIGKLTIQEKNEIERLERI